MFEGGQISEGGDKFPRKFGRGDNFPEIWPGGQIFGGDIFPVTPGLRIESFAIIKLRDVTTKLNIIFFTMQTFKELIRAENT